MLLRSAKCPRMADGKTPYERRFGEQFKGPIIPCGAKVEYHPTSPRGPARIHQFGKKVLLGIFPVCEPVAGEIWNGDILTAYLEDFRWYSKIVRKRLRIPRNHCDATTDREE